MKNQISKKKKGAAQQMSYSHMLFGVYANLAMESCFKQIQMIWVKLSSVPGHWEFCLSFCGTAAEAIRTYKIQVESKDTGPIRVCKKIPQAHTLKRFGVRPTWVPLGSHILH